MNTGNLSGNAEWANEYGLTHPVLVDNAGAVSRRFDTDASVPGHTLLAPGLEILVKDSVSIPNLDDYL